MHLHVFTGRAGILLSIINGSLGFRLVNAVNAHIITYGVFAGLVGVAYSIVIMVGESRSERQVPRSFTAPLSETKRLDRQDDSGNGSE